MGKEVAKKHFVFKTLGGNTYPLKPPGGTALLIYVKHVLPTKSVTEKIWKFYKRLFKILLFRKFNLILSQKSKKDSSL